jgi:hypothetical protein
MEKQSRRQAVRDYKERKVQAGVFAVRCGPGGETWVGQSRNIAAQQNPIWFGLRLGSHQNRAMQSAWAAHGPDAFAFEVLEAVDAADLTPLGLDELLKRREKHWLEELGARKAFG